MRRCVALVVLALTVSACGAEGAGSTNAVWRSELRDRIADVRSAFLARDDDGARRALARLRDDVAVAHERGVLSPADRRRIDQDLAVVDRRLRTGAGDGRLTGAEPPAVSTTTPVAAPPAEGEAADDDDREDAGEGEGEGEGKGKRKGEGEGKGRKGRDG